MSDATMINERPGPSLEDRTLSYWRRFNLKQSPFEDYPQFAMYYPIVHWQSHLKYLQQFCSGSQSLLLIEGEFGIGKSMLLAQLLTQLSDDISSYQIKGRSTITAAQLIAEIAQGFQLPLALSQPTLREQIDAELATLQRLQKKCLLVIDDADLLPTETLATLAHLAMTQTEGQICLYILLTCELDLQSHIENLAKEQSRLVYFPTLTLAPLSIEETKNYLKHRLAKSGLADKNLFTKEMIARVHDLSAGVPGRINRVAQQTLIDLSRSSGRRVAFGVKSNDQRISLWKKHYVRLVSVVVMLFIIIGIASYKMEKPLRPQLSSSVVTRIELPGQKKIMQQDAPIIANATLNKPQKLHIAEEEVIGGNTSPAPMNPPEAEAIAKNIPVQINGTQNTVEQNSIAQNKITIVPLINEKPLPTAAPVTPKVPVPVVTKDTTNTYTNTNSMVSVAEPAIRVGKSPTAIVISPFPLNNVKMNTVDTKESAKRNITKVGENNVYTAAEKKLLAMQGYTLQFLGSRKASDLNRLIATHKLSATNMMQFQTQLQGKPWHVLVYGNYATPKAAKLALNQLPKSIQALHPWVRPMTSVHSAIKANI